MVVLDEIRCACFLNFLGTCCCQGFCFHRCKSIFFELEMMKKTACELEHNVWDVAADETASAVRYGFKDYFLCIRRLWCN
ncbi:fucokinase [Trifolium repens]|nr:fucokinase [Trifolium repens]